MKDTYQMKTNNSMNTDSKYPTLSTTNSDINHLKFRFKIFEGQKMMAIATIEFGDFVIKGFRISRSDFKDANGEDELWVVPPSYRDSGGRYHPIFFSPNKGLWEEIKKRMLDEFHIQSAEHFLKRMKEE